MSDLELIKQRWLAIMTSDDCFPEKFGEQAARELLLVEAGFKKAAAAPRPLVEIEPLPAPGTPTQTAPASHGETR